jgi:hypothetical protein
LTYKAEGRGVKKLDWRGHKGEWAANLKTKEKPMTMRRKVIIIP